MGTEDLRLLCRLPLGMSVVFNTEITQEMPNVRFVGG